MILSTSFCPCPPCHDDRSAGEGHVLAGRGRREWCGALARLPSEPRRERRRDPLFFQSIELPSEKFGFLSSAAASPAETTMGAIKRKADQGSTPSKKEKASTSDRSAKRRKSDVAAAPSPAKAKPESSAPKSVFKDEETSFPRGGASVLTPLEHKQIQIQANQDVLFEQAGIKRKGGDDGFSDMGSEDGEQATPKSSKKTHSKKSKKSRGDGEEEKLVRVEGLSYKVRQSNHLALAALTGAEIVAWNHRPRTDHGYNAPRYRARPSKQSRWLRAPYRCLG